MSVTLAAEEFWSKILLKEHEAALKMFDYTDKRFEKEMSYGDQIKVKTISKVILHELTGDTISNPQSMTFGETTIMVDQRFYYYLKDQDIDKIIRKNKSDFARFVKGAGRAIAESKENFVARIAALGASKQATEAQSSVTDDTCIAALDKAILYLRREGVEPNMEAEADIPWIMHERIKSKIITLSTDNVELLKKGYVGTYSGILIRPTNFCYKNSNVTHGVVRTRESVATIDLASTYESARPVDGFFDIVKGMAVYGGKVTKPKEVIDIPIAEVL